MNEQAIRLAGKTLKVGMKDFTGSVTFNMNQKTSDVKYDIRYCNIIHGHGLKDASQPDAELAAGVQRKD